MIHFLQQQSYKRIISFKRTKKNDIRLSWEKKPPNWCWWGKSNNYEQISLWISNSISMCCLFEHYLLNSINYYTMWTLHIHCKNASSLRKKMETLTKTLKIFLFPSIIYFGKHGRSAKYFLTLLSFWFYTLLHIFKNHTWQA